MRLPLAALVPGGIALAIFLGTALQEVEVPFSYVHPDEQRTGLAVDALTRTAPAFPQDLAPLAHLFRPLNTNWNPTDPQGYSTALAADGGAGFGYSAYLAAFEMIDVPLYVGGALALALLYVGSVLFLDARKPAAWALALLPCAVPPAFIETGLLFSNLPGLAFHVLATGIAAEGFRSHRPLLLAAAVSLSLLAGALRLDYLLSLALFLPLLVALAAREPRPGRIASLGAVSFSLILGVFLAAAAFFVGNGTWGLPYTHAITDDPGTNLTTLAVVREQAMRSFAGVKAHASPEFARVNLEAYLFGFTPAILAIGALYTARPSTDERVRAWLILPLLAHGSLMWFFMSDVPHYGLGSQYVDGSLPRYVLPFFAGLALLGAAGLLAQLGRLRAPRTRVVGAVLVAALLAAPGVATTWSAEHGLAWVHEMRRWQDGYEQAARALPEDAVLAGNYLSKIVYARPVLVPDYAGAGFPTIVTKITWLGRPVFVNQEWLEPGKDERGVFGQQLMRSGHHVLMASGVQTYYQVLPTNATVRQVFDLHRGEWDAESNESRLQPTAERAFFRIVDRPDGALPLNGRVPANVVLRVTYLDEDANATVRVGYVNFDSGSTVELGAWHSQGNGAWVTREVTLRAGLVVTGEMFVDGAPPIRELQAVWR